MTCPIPSTRRSAFSLALIGSVALAGCGDDMEAREAAEYEEITDTATEVMPALDPTDLEAEFAELDLDANDALDLDEFTRWADENEFTWAAWSEDDTEGPEALHGTLFNRFDTDENEAVSRSEFDRHATLFPDAVSEGDFGAWDTDGSGELNRSEFVAGFATTDLHARIDSDGDASISDDEFVAFFYDLVDADDDEMIDSDEWTEAERFHPDTDM